VQLRAKQKLKVYANCRNGIPTGSMTRRRRLKGDTGANMIGLLSAASTRDYAPNSCPRFSRRASLSVTAISVNGKRVTVSSYRVKIGDEVKSRRRRSSRAGLEANGLASATCGLLRSTTQMTAKIHAAHSSDVPYRW